MNRVVVPEILDELSYDDPRAIRSRRDLKLVNWFMRGQSWILKELDELVGSGGVKRIVELGAGDGGMISACCGKFSEVECIAVDLIPRPVGVHDDVYWHEGDLFEYEGYEEGTVVIANLFLHHLLEDQLKALGEKAKSIKAFLCAEPYRATVPLYFGKVIYPFINDVTRHDMVVSIKAGFKQAELPYLLGDHFDWKEEKGLFGGIRTKGVAP